MAIGIHKFEDHEACKLLWLKWMEQHRPDLLEKITRVKIKIKKQHNV